ncbi:MAG: hypothetical protein H6Q19_1222 [Bacteroidetes bacterium]|nr:hypothetical protein [Bacteroidota bacterium]
MATVLITGGNGLIGRYLTKMLLETGYEVSVLSRSSKPARGCKVFLWDPERQQLDHEAIDTADYIIHLAGENIGSKRWTTKRKKEIIDSRVLTAKLLYEKVTERKRSIRAFISASATGYYGMVTTDKIFTETDLPSEDFTGITCRRWEEVASDFQKAGIRTVIIRTAVVLDKQNKALSKMIFQIKAGVGAAVGSGRQYLPWIHISDLCRIYIKALEDNNMSGAYNAVAPEQVTNKEFMKKLSLVLHKPFWLPNIPAFFLKLLFGGMSGLLLEGSRISSEKIQAAGFEFLYHDLENALKNILK